MKATIGPTGARTIGRLAIVTSVLYFASDVIEVAQDGFSTGQLWLTLVAEAAIPVFLVGLLLATRPRLGRIGEVSAAAYAYAYVYFTVTVVYALVNQVGNFEELNDDLAPWMTVHGAIMLLAGLGLGYAVIRSTVLPRWSGAALAVGVVLVVIGLPGPAGLVGPALRDLAFVGMGWALVVSARD